MVIPLKHTPTTALWHPGGLRACYFRSSPKIEALPYQALSQGSYFPLQSRRGKPIAHLCQQAAIPYLGRGYLLICI